MFIGNGLPARLKRRNPSRVVSPPRASDSPCLEPQPRDEAEATPPASVGPQKKDTGVQSDDGTTAGLGQSIWALAIENLETAADLAIEHGGALPPDALHDVFEALSALANTGPVPVHMPHEFLEVVNVRLPLTDALWTTPRVRCALLQLLSFSIRNVTPLEGGCYPDGPYPPGGTDPSWRLQWLDIGFAIAIQLGRLFATLDMLPETTPRLLCAGLSITRAVTQTDMPACLSRLFASLAATGEAPSTRESLAGATATRQPRTEPEASSGGSYDPRVVAAAGTPCRGSGSRVGNWCPPEGADEAIVSSQRIAPIGPHAAPLGDPAPAPAPAPAAQSGGGVAGGGQRSCDSGEDGGRDCKDHSARPSVKSSKSTCSGWNGADRAAEGGAADSTADNTAPNSVLVTWNFAAQFLVMLIRASRGFCWGRAAPKGRMADTQRALRGALLCSRTVEHAVRTGLLLLERLKDFRKAWRHVYSDISDIMKALVGLSRNPAVPRAVTCWAEALLSGPAVQYLLLAGVVSQLHAAGSGTAYGLPESKLLHPVLLGKVVGADEDAQRSFQSVGPVRSACATSCAAPGRSTGEEAGLVTGDRRHPGQEGKPDPIGRDGSRVEGDDEQGSGSAVEGGEQRSDGRQDGQRREDGGGDDGGGSSSTASADGATAGDVVSVDPMLISFDLWATSSARTRPCSDRAIQALCERAVAVAHASWAASDRAAALLPWGPVPSSSAAADGAETCPSDGAGRRRPHCFRDDDSLRLAFKALQCALFLKRSKSQGDMELPRPLWEAVMRTLGAVPALGPVRDAVRPFRAVDPFTLLERTPLPRLQMPEEGVDLPPTPPPRVSAALDAGYIPTLERLLRHTGRLAQDAALSGGARINELLPALSCLVVSLGRPDSLAGLLAYGEPRAAAALLATIAKLMRLAAATAIAECRRFQTSKAAETAQEEGDARGDGFPQTRASFQSLVELMGAIAWALNGYLENAIVLRHDALGAAGLDRRQWWGAVDWSAGSRSEGCANTTDDSIGAAVNAVGTASASTTTAIAAPVTTAASSTSSTGDGLGVHLEGHASPDDGGDLCCVVAASIVPVDLTGPGASRRKVRTRAPRNGASTAGLTGGPSSHVTGPLSTGPRSSRPSRGSPSSSDQSSSDPTIRSNGDDPRVTAATPLHRLVLLSSFGVHRLLPSLVALGFAEKAFMAVHFDWKNATVSRNVWRETLPWLTPLLMAAREHSTAAAELVGAQQERAAAAGVTMAGRRQRGPQWPAAATAADAAAVKGRAVTGSAAVRPHTRTTATSVEPGPDASTDTSAASVAVADADAAALQELLVEVSGPEVLVQLLPYILPNGRALSEPRLAEQAARAGLLLAEAFPADTASCLRRVIVAYGGGNMMASQALTAALTPLDSDAARRLLALLPGLMSGRPQPAAATAAVGGQNGAGAGRRRNGGRGTNGSGNAGGRVGGGNGGHDGGGASGSGGGSRGKQMTPESNLVELWDATMSGLMVPPATAAALLGLPRCGNTDCANLDGDSEAGLRWRGCRGGCGAVVYCSRECQEAHWRAGHKAACGGGRRS